MSRQEHSALLIACLATLSLLLTLAACTEVVTSTPTSSPTTVPTVNPTPTPTMTLTPSPPRPTPKSLVPPVPTSRVRDIPLPHEPCTPPVDIDGNSWDSAGNYYPVGFDLEYHAGVSPEEHPYFHGRTGFGRPTDSFYNLHFHYERYEHFVAWTQSASHVVFDIDDVIWTLNLDSAELNEIADVDSDYMRLDGSTTYHQRMAYGFYGDVSPDGSHIVYSTCEYPLPGSIGEYGYELGIASVDGTGKRRLTNNTYFEHYPVWSPDGSKVAFLRNSGLHDYQDGAQLSIMSVDTTSASLTAAVGAESGRLRDRHRHLPGYRSCRDDSTGLVSWRGPPRFCCSRRNSKRIPRRHLSQIVRLRTLHYSLRLFRTAQNRRNDNTARLVSRWSAYCLRYNVQRQSENTYR